MPFIHFPVDSNGVETLVEEAVIHTISYKAASQTLEVKTISPATVYTFTGPAALATWTRLVGLSQVADREKKPARKNRRS